MASKLFRVTTKFAKQLGLKSVTQTSVRLQSTKVVTYEEALNSVPITQCTPLNNGLRVASEEMDIPTATVGVWIDSGSRYETSANNGVSNLLEHMIFKGTGSRSQATLEREVEAMGAQMSAFTTREMTAYFIKCMNYDVEQAISILSDVLQNSVLDTDEMERQRKVILKEMDELDTNLEEVTMNYLHATAYQGTALAKSVIGGSNSVKNLNRSQLLEYYTNQYKAPRMVLATAGGVPHDHLVDMADKHFGEFSTQYESEIPVLTQARFTGSEIEARDDDLPLAHCAIAVEGCGWDNADSIPLQVAATLIGSWDRTHGGGPNLASALAAGCSENKDVHCFKSFFIPYTDTSLWGNYFVVDREMIEGFVFALQTQWMQLCSNVTDFEVERAKNQLKTRMWRQLCGGTSTIADDIGRQYIMYGRRVPIAEFDSRINAVDAKMVRDVCYKYIYDTCPAVVGVGPTEQLPDYNRTRAGMYWLRF